MNFIPNLSFDICAVEEIVSDSLGLRMMATKVNSSLNDYDAIIIPGGFGTRKLQFNKIFINWVKTAADDAFKISVCTGSLVLGAAGFLEGKKATTNYQE